ncbi:5-carboxymethyl-2-hydroxymuconate delta-isomerase [Leeia sp. TBRC 13508]|uniref:5-carboxymethyl-2-hydroxymuconate delta-isomerase n=1 Tax=Leeia speluncae TaxID=2884804 RepID=A0ABS8D9W2_9NEIS|nr:5-carboxymethyl-2-hydroxymuconate delta-isomerase [Leeia speluncae]MCB6184947.1 5-carboxymethyl-2-hydroxymuconate delta-isomerase [Leeia speluncae]
MPHFIVECTENLRDSADFQPLFAQVHEYMAGTGIFPIGGIRSRVHWIDTYRMADAAADYAFVHITLKVGHGRDEATRKAVGDHLFGLVKTHFAKLMEDRYLALSFEMVELHPVLNYKHNNVHARFK